MNVPLKKNRLTRSDTIEGLRLLITRLHDVGEKACIRIVGGTAISFTVDDSRPPTQDIDISHVPSETFWQIAQEIAQQKGWGEDWINDNADQFVPRGYGEKDAEWDILYDCDGVKIEVAAAAPLLAMKLRAYARRGARDEDDVAMLLAQMQPESAEQVEELVLDYFPGEEFSPKLFASVQRLVSSLPPPSHAVPPRF